MSALMRKTKRELIEMIEMIETIQKENRPDETAATNDENRIRKLENRLKTVTTDNQSLRERFIESEQKKAEIVEEMGDLNKDYHELKEDYEALQQVKADLTEQISFLNKRLDILEAEVRKYRDQYRASHDLFNSFVEEADKRILLMDASYTIRYANAAALEYLGLPEPAEIIDRRFFDLLDIHEAVRLKEKIDQAYLNGGVEKIKKITYQRMHGDKMKLQMKIERVRYQDKPSVKIILK